MRRNIINLTIVFLLVGISAMAQQKRYVSVTGTSTGTAIGNWGNASNDLQLVINQAVAGDTICIAAGTYIPIRPAYNLNLIDSNNRRNSFTITKNLVILGGYNSSTGDRNWNTYKTILSGDIGVPNDSSDNCYHVIIAASIPDSAYFDGFTVTKGAAYGSGQISNLNNNRIIDGHGGGIVIANSLLNLRNLIIENNSANRSSNTGYSEGDGGGIYIAGILSSGYYAGSIVNILDSVKIANNTASNNGGGIFFLGTLNIFGSAEITNNTVSRNGGGISSFNVSGINNTLNISDYVKITNNKAYDTGSNYSSGGGGIYIQSGTLNISDYAEITNNTAIIGGGIASMDTIRISDYVKITNNNVYGIGNNTYQGCGGGIYARGTLTISDYVKITNNTAYSNGNSGDGSSHGSGGGIYMSSGTLNIYDYVKITNNTAYCPISNYFRYSGGGGGIYGFHTPIINIYGGYIDSNTATGGGGIYTHGTLNIYGYAKIANNTAYSLNSYSAGGGGGINGGYNSTINIFGGYIGINKANEGGGIYSWGILNIFDSAKITNNTADTNGGGICGFGWSGANIGTINISGGYIDSNTANSGGGIYSIGTLNIYNSAKITNNTASRGGGIYKDGIAYSGATANISGGYIDRNTANHGAGIYITSGSSSSNNNTLNISDSAKIIKNTASNNGGGIYGSKGTYSSLTINISGGHIDSNTSNDGGGIYFIGSSMSSFDGGTLNISDSAKITNNTADSSGGGIYINGYLNISNYAKIIGNAASNGGGIYSYWGWGDSAKIKGGEISNNTSTGTRSGNGGGGIYTNSLERLIIDSPVVFSGNKAVKASPWMTTTATGAMIPFRDIYLANCPMPTLYYSSIVGKTWGLDYDNLYNNYDINMLPPPDCYFTIEEQATNNEVHHRNTKVQTHTFEDIDTIVVKRTVEVAFSYVTWRINGAPYSISESGNSIHTLKFPATAFVHGTNTITMVVRLQSGVDSIYTGLVWLMRHERVELCAGDSVTLRTTITDGGTSPTYQWYINDTLVPGATDTLFRYFPIDGDTIRCTATSDAECADPSNVLSQKIYITVTPKADSTFIQVRDTAICYNTTVTLSVETPLSNAIYRWYDTQISDTALHVGTTYTPSPALKASRSYFISVQDSSGLFCENDTNNRKEIRVIVYDTLKAGVIGTNYSMCVLAKPSAITETTASVGSDSISYKWQVSINGSSWSDIPSANAKNYTPDTLTQTTYFRRVDTDEKCGTTAYTNVVTVTVDTVPVLNGDIVFSGTLCTGQTIQVSYSESAVIGQWSKNNNNVNIGNVDANPTTITGVTASTTPTFITYTVTNGQCQTKVTKSITVTGSKQPVIRIGIER